MFDLQAGHVSFQQGVLNFENRASEFDFQNRFPCSTSMPAISRS